jgi:hypothetical protein
MDPWPRYVPDLTLWYPWHAERGTLPGRWKGMSLPAVCRDLGVPAWRTVKPWRVELPGIEVRDTRTDAERTLRWTAPSGTLTSRWVLGPDGDWWRSEYPVKSRDDMAAAREVADARRYVMVPDEAVSIEKTESGNDMTAIELPQRPWSELFHAFLGWSEGLMLFLEEPDSLQAVVAALEKKLQRLVVEAALLPGRMVLSPDNLDGQFVTPSAFEENLAASYRATAEALHAGGKLLVVHVGGPVRTLLPGLAASGVDCVEGVCGTPQGDTSLAEARALCGQSVTLWGGIAQDFLLPTRSQDEFEAAADAAFAETARDPRAVVGVADRVPVGALPERLRQLTRRGLQS